MRLVFIRLKTITTLRKSTYFFTMFSYAVLFSLTGCKFFQKSKINSLKIPDACSAFERENTKSTYQFPSPKDWADGYLKAFNKEFSVSATEPQFSAKIEEFQKRTACQILDLFTKVDLDGFKTKANARLAFLKKEESLIKEFSDHEFPSTNYEKIVKSLAAKMYAQKKNISIYVGNTVMDPEPASKHLFQWIDQNLKPTDLSAFELMSNVKRIINIFNQLKSDLDSLETLFGGESQKGLAHLQTLIDEIYEAIKNSNIDNKLVTKAAFEFIDLISLTEPKVYGDFKENSEPYFLHDLSQNLQAKFANPSGHFHLFPMPGAFSLRESIVMRSVPIYPIGISTKVFGTNGLDKVDGLTMTPSFFAVHDRLHADAMKASDILTLFMNKAGQKNTDQAIAQSITGRAQFIQFLLDSVDSQPKQNIERLEAVLFCAFHEVTLSEELTQKGNTIRFNSNFFSEYHEHGKTGSLMFATANFPPHPSFLDRYDSSGPKGKPCEVNVLNPMGITRQSQLEAESKLKLFSQEFCKVNSRLSICDSSEFFNL